MGGVQSPFSLSFSLCFQPADPLPCGWLVLFIEALVLFPNIEREGSQQWRANLKGTTSTSYPDKSGLRLQKGSGDDAILGSTMSSVSPSFWSWSRCTDMANFV